MIEIRPLMQLNFSDFRKVASGYVSDGKYVVVYSDREERISFVLQLVGLNRPYVKRWAYDDETLRRYEGLLSEGFSIGAYDGDLLVGLVVAEPQVWNGSLWVWEFHVSDAYRQRGIGRRLMERVVARGEAAGFRVIVCETQNTNVPAIKVYRLLGFRVEGVDISYYSNDDYPEGEMAVFMKRYL
jgi:ribosomal protein S18 acetylase RimI-like enzyme